MLVDYHLITLMILLPFIGSVGQVFVPHTGKYFEISRWLALVTSVLASLCGIVLVFSMQPNTSELQASEMIAWIGSYAIAYDVAVDGLSALMVLLVALVFPILIISEWPIVQVGRGIRGLFLLLQAAFFGVVCAQDIFLLFFFWMMSILPLYFLISIWGERERENAAFRFIITAAIGSMLIFAAFILIYYSVTPHTFSLRELLGADLTGKTIGLFGQEFSISKTAFLLLCLGIAFRIPIWPFHGWFTYIATQASAAVLVVMCGVFIPLSLYVFTRISFSLFPVEVAYYSRFIIVFGVINVLFGSVCAIAQTELQLFLSFLCLAQAGVLLVGIGSLDPAGVVGSVYQAFALGLGLSGFGFISGLIKNRTGQTVFLGKTGKPFIGGLSTSAPIMALVTGLIIVSLLGFPGLGGFVGQALIIMGGYAVHPAVIILSGFGLILMTFSLFSAYRYIFLGRRQDETRPISDLSTRERGVLFPLVFVLLFLGIYPKPLLDLVRPSVLTLLSVLK